MNRPENLESGGKIIPGESKSLQTLMWYVPLGGPGFGNNMGSNPGIGSQGSRGSPREERTSRKRGGHLGQSVSERLREEVKTWDMRVDSTTEGYGDLDESSFKGLGSQELDCRAGSGSGGSGDCEY